MSAADVLAVNFDSGAVSIFQYDNSWNKLANDLTGGLIDSSIAG